MEIHSSKKSSTLIKKIIDRDLPISMSHLVGYKTPILQNSNSGLADLSRLDAKFDACEPLQVLLQDALGVIFSHFLASHPSQQEICKGEKENTQLNEHVFADFFCTYIITMADYNSSAWSLVHFENSKLPRYSWTKNTAHPQETTNHHLTIIVPLLTAIYYPIDICLYLETYLHD